MVVNLINHVLVLFLSHLVPIAAETDIIGLSISLSRNNDNNIITKDNMLGEKRVRRFVSEQNINSHHSNSTTTRSTPNGIVSFVPSSGKVSVLHSFPATFFASETVFDSKSKIYWMLVGDNLVGFNTVTNTLLPQIALDTTQCSGGSACFSELRWDSMHQRIVAVGMGFVKPGGRIVGIDISNGSVISLSASFSKDCALYIECSSFDAMKQIFYPWLACADAPTASLYAFNLQDQSNMTVLDQWDFHAVLGPSKFVPNFGIVAVNEDNSLVHVDTTNMTNTTTLLTKTLGGIPSINGLAVANNIAYISLVEYNKNKLAIVQLTSSFPALIEFKNISLTINNPFTYESR